MGKNEKIVLRVVVFVAALYVFTSTVPALLSAANDLAVMLGVMLVIAVGVCGFLYAKKIINWFLDI